MLADRIWHDVQLATMDPALPGLGLIDKAIVACLDGKIVYAGAAGDAPADLDAKQRIDCSGRLVTPGLVDCHTHLVYGGDRAHEFQLRLAGASYEQIAREGGGIQSTVRLTRQSTDAELTYAALTRLDALIADGVTTVEIKSGYGLEPNCAPARQTAAGRHCHHVPWCACLAARGERRQGRLHR